MMWVAVFVSFFWPCFLSDFSYVSTDFFYIVDMDSYMVMDSFTTKFDLLKTDPKVLGFILE